MIVYRDFDMTECSDFEYTRRSSKDAAELFFEFVCRLCFESFKELSVLIKDLDSQIVYIIFFCKSDVKVQLTGCGVDSGMNKNRRVLYRLKSRRTFCVSSLTRRDLRPFWERFFSRACI